MVQPLDYNEIVCASKARCIVPECPRATAHNCPCCGYSIHAICGHLNEDASIQFKTTCFICFEKFGRSLKDPDDIAVFLSNKMTGVLPEEQSTKGVEHQNQAAGKRNNNDNDMMNTAVNENDDVDIMEADSIEKD